MDPNQPTTLPPAAPVTGSVVANPGKGIGIASLIVSFLGIGLVGLILGIIGINKSKAAGQGNGFAIAGIILGILNIIATIIFVIVMVGAAGVLLEKCKELGPGSHVVDGVTYTCPASTASN
ncbi:MAG: hypothetical protein WAO28_01195 [Candidatus Microsaccharimonas sp.]